MTANRQFDKRCDGSAVIHALELLYVPPSHFEVAAVPIAASQGARSPSSDSSAKSTLSSILKSIIKDMLHNVRVTVTDTFCNLNWTKMLSGI